MTIFNEYYKEELVGKPFELLTIEEMEDIQGNGWFADATASSAGCVATITASSGWCGAGIVVGTILYSVMKCG